MRKKIVSIGVELPAEVAEAYNFYDDSSLLDADIILFVPDLPKLHCVESYKGQSCLNDDDSFRVKKALKHWRNELHVSLEAGKLVVVLLETPHTVWAATGEMQYSGTGRSKTATRIVDQISSYDALPFNYAYSSTSGSGMQILPSAQLIKLYWNEFAKSSYYNLYLTGQVKEPLVKTKSGDRVVGAAHRIGNGLALLLPFIDFSEPSYTETRKKGDKEVEYWSKIGMSHCNRFAASLCAIAEVLSSGVSATPPPSWAEANEFKTRTERELSNEIARLSSEMDRVQKLSQKASAQLQDAGTLRKLLYEQGKPLEVAVLESLRLMGFDADRYESGGSEFDAVFSSKEGRFIGEIEGKDAKAINIDKFSQLERNISEDFQRDEITEHAKGVLFGNAYRTLPLTERSTPFTEKCLQAAKRMEAALIHTPDLFFPASYLKENLDKDFAEKCRTAIFAAKGEIVKFPSPPNSELSKAR